MARCSGMPAKFFIRPLFLPSEEIFNYSGGVVPAIADPSLNLTLPREPSKMLRNLLSPRKLSLFFFLTGAMVWVANGNAVVAQEDEILNRLYGNGVHAYKRGDYVEAHRWLSEAIDTGNRDPRTRYFRGLAYLKLGRPEQASNDFDQAADREVGDGNLTKLVDQSLVTVQGPDRYRLESARTNAQRERHLRNRGMMRERNAEPELIQPGMPRSAEPTEGTMKDLPTPGDEELLESDKESDSAPSKADDEDELFSTESTEEAEKDQPVKSDPPEEEDSDDLFGIDFDEE